MAFCQIEELEWGRVVISKGQKRYEAKDVILCGDLVPVDWNWKDNLGHVDTSHKTPLRHSPGIEKRSIQNVLSYLDRYSCDKVLLISKGVQDQLPVKEFPDYDTFKYAIYNETTNENLVKSFNRINNGVTSVCALMLHTTC